MKMKKTLLALALAGFTAVPALAQDPNQPASRHIGDGVRSIGDTNRYVEPALDQRPSSFKKESKTALVSHSRKLDMGLLAPTTSCDTGSGLGLLDNCGMNSGKWFSAESLLWFADSMNSPVLVTTSDPGVAPIQGDPGVSNAFGGAGALSSGLLPGYRVEAGTYFGDCQKVGLGGRVFGLFSGGSSYSNSGDGTVGSIGIPYFDQNTSQNEVYDIAFNNGAPVSSGFVNASSELEMVTAEGSFRFLLSRSSDHRVDLLAGYTHSNLKNSLGLITQSVNEDTGDLITDGTIFDTNDLFSTENVFNGAHLGVVSSVVKNRTSLSTLAKISFGNMRQTATVAGSSVSTDPIGGPTAAVGGLFAQQSNIGSATQDSFAFIPEMGLKLGYQVRDNVSFTVGYTFLLYSSVALAGDQMDNTLDLLQVAGPPGNRPAPLFQDTAFWLQGVDLGLSWTY